MAVIFDEVVGTVEPEATASPGEGEEQPAKPEDPMALGRALRRRAQRDARLRAD